MNYYYVNRQNPNKVRFLGKTGHENMIRVKEAANWKFIKVVSDEEKAKMILDIEKAQKDAKNAKELKFEALENESLTVKSKAKELSQEEVEKATKGKKVVIEEEDEDEAEIEAAQNAAKETLGKGGKKDK
jgi:hypothetical protein